MSPIMNLTQRAGSFPRVGVLRKGAPKPSGNKPGRDLDYFRMDSTESGIAEKFAEAYGGQPRRINVFLPHKTTEQNFDCWNEHWVAGGLVHKCDGERVLRARQPDGKIKSYDDVPRLDRPDCPGGCTPVGRLSVIIPELGRLVSFTAQTGGKHDIITLTQSLRAVEEAEGSLQGIPFVLSRYDAKISTPGTDGKRVRRQKSLLRIEAAPSWVAFKLKAMASAVPQLAAGDDPLADALGIEPPDLGDPDDRDLFPWVPETSGEPDAGPKPIPLGTPVNVDVPAGPPGPALTAAQAAFQAQARRDMPEGGPGSSKNPAQSSGLPTYDEMFPDGEPDLPDEVEDMTWKEFHAAALVEFKHVPNLGAVLKASLGDKWNKTHSKRVCWEALVAANNACTPK